MKISNYFFYCLKIIFFQIRIMLAELSYYKYKCLTLYIYQIYQFTYKILVYLKVNFLLVFYFFLVDFYSIQCYILANYYPMIVFTSPRSFMSYFLVKYLFNSLKNIIVFNVNRKPLSHMFTILVSSLVFRTRMLGSPFSCLKPILL